ncbi:MAG: tetratricopeptide repeat protein [Deltaproteobacteria bacterium]|nr:tetratricopeptide repeat protein [Deltaproteobacteria bacterium]
MSTQSKYILTVLFTFSFATVLARPGQAERREKNTAESHYQRGMKAYTLGKFPEAIEEFEKAYELRSEPVFLYNIAQSHRQNNSPQRAIFFYRRYLEAEPQAKNRADIEQRIQDLQANLNGKPENATEPAPAPVAQPVPPQPLPPPQPVVVQPMVVAQSQAQPDADAGRGLRIGGIVTGAVGLAGIGAGIFFFLHANSLYEEATKPGSVYDAAKDDSSKTFRGLGWAAVGTGAAAVVTGGVLYFLGAKKRSAAPVALAPIIAPGVGGAALCGRF